MRNHALALITGIFVVGACCLETESARAMDTNQMDQTQVTSFTPFTGKVTRNKVRLRLHPNLDGSIIKELSQGDMLIVVDENDEFYAIQPPADLKGYVFRTYILDNIVEANRVNVRLEPELDAPVIAQLHNGDRLDGAIISTRNNKWFEISPPSSARLYVSKDYIEKIGDAKLMAAIEKKRDEANILLNTAYVNSQDELQKPFPEIHLESIYGKLNKIIGDYKDFPQQIARARELLSSIQDSYLQKKIAFLEAKTKVIQDDWQSKNTQLSEQMKQQQQKLSHMEQQIKRNQGTSSYNTTERGSSLSAKMAAWLPAEKALYEQWSHHNEGRSEEEFYREQSEQALALRGIIEPYNRVIKNKPGDYILVNQTTHLPIAYLYSTIVNLQERIGQEVTIYGSQRDNKNFAFPAYFVHSTD